MEQVPTLDIARIKQYNASLKEYTEKSANTRAQLELSKQEVTRLCQELSAELNIQVTPDNLEEVYRQCVEKIQNTLNTGEEILQRIKAEDSKSDTFTEQVQPENKTLPGFGELPQMFGTPNIEI